MRQASHFPHKNRLHCGGVGGKKGVIISKRLRCTKDRGLMLAVALFGHTGTEPRLFFRGMDLFYPRQKLLIMISE